MELLEFFYEKSIIKQHFLPRRVQLAPSSRILLTGPKYSGKYALVQQFLRTYAQPKKTLLVDFEDTRADKEEIVRTIDVFIQEKEIATLVYYGYTPGIPLPACRQIIVVAHHNVELEGFLHYRLRNLDFEEFMLFEKRSEPKVAINHFLRLGNYPEMVRIDEFKKEKRIQELYRLTFGEDFVFFKELAYYQGQNVSVHFLFERIKERHKISKDRFYALLGSWERSGYIHFIPKYGAKRAAKKLFFHNFTAKSELWIQKEFPKIFENMVYLEIADEEVYYLEPLGLYLPEYRKAVLAIPFGTEARIQARIEQLLAKNRIDIDTIEVITVANSFRYEVGTIVCEVLPFYEWALAK